MKKHPKSKRQSSRPDFGKRNDSRPFGKPTPNRKNNDRGPSAAQSSKRDSERKEQISDELTQKSHADIKSWLDKGKKLRDAAAGIPKKPEDPKDFALDTWQQEVLDLLNAGENVIVDAPTTAGKTRAVEVFFAQNLNNPNFRAAYTTPVKSLSNDKLRELRAMFGEKNVGISTGDIKENLDAPIVVATLESYRNSLLGTEPDFGRTLVVFDEYHYLQDEGRGSAWEEALILTPPSCQVLLLSASVANSGQFSEWVGTLFKKRCTLIQTLHRPVPLTNVIYYADQWITQENLPQEAYKKLNPNLQERPITHEELAKKVLGLLPLELSPVILYTGKRFDAENLAAEIEKSLKPLPPEESLKIGDSLQKSHKEVSALTFIKPAMRRMIQTYGVAYHHSGLAPAARIAIENLVKEGLLRFCVATMGLSLGINFSVRSALIADYQRPSEKGPTDYAQSEILQMLGRAGRRGKDVIGFSLWPNVESFVKMGQAKREACDSNLRTDPTTFLGLVGRGFSLGMIEAIYNRSFKKYQNKQTEFRLVRRSEVENKLSTESLPCTSPAKEFATFRYFESRRETAGRVTETACHTCTMRGPCHGYAKYRSNSSKLAAMHMHLLRIQCIDDNEKLTTFGEIARYFPQSGGLLVARMLTDGQITTDKLLAACELFAALAMPKFKEITTTDNYRFPFDPVATEKDLKDLYPLDLFPELYDAPFGRRTYYQFKDFNPGAGWVARLWLKNDISWADFSKAVTGPYFGAGDLMGLLYRVGTYLQSVAGSDLPGARESAKGLRSVLLRSPLDFTL